MNTRLVLLGIPALIVAGCPGSSDSSDGPSTVEKRPDAAVAASASAPTGTCPLTLPNERTAPGGNDAGMNHGNGRLWTAMWPHNVVIATPDYIEPDGSVGMKWPWWRGVEGKLTVTGRRLDGEAPALTADVPEGYGRTGFQPSGITFPTDGCWEVTATAGNAKLTFVTLVLKASRYRPLDESG